MLCSIVRGLFLIILYGEGFILHEMVTFVIQVSINSFPDYKLLLQENYVEYKHIFF